MQNIKKHAFGLLVMAGLTISVMPSAQAQGWQWPRGTDRRGQSQQQDQRQRNDGYGQVDRNGNIDHNRDGIDDRYQTNRDPRIDRNGNIDRNRNGVDDRYENNRDPRIDRNGNIDRNRNGVDDRYENNRDPRIDRNRNGVNDRYENNGRYRDNDRYGYGGYGNGNYGYNNGEMQKGYRDGLDRGQEDARSRRTSTPNNSQHFRNGSAAYREGFSRGYFEGYRQYGNRW
ncbi:MAG: hypothetical protein IPL01_16430 [Acidobacteria bacterium]|nr:hypothetical protein [Acidobacteriota bacterium]